MAYINRNIHIVQSYIPSLSIGLNLQQQLILQALALDDAAVTKRYLVGCPLEIGFHGEEDRRKLESENNAHYSPPTGSTFRLSVAKLCVDIGQLWLQHHQGWHTQAAWSKMH